MLHFMRVILEKGFLDVAKTAALLIPASMVALSKISYRQASTWTTMTKLPKQHVLAVIGGLVQVHHLHF